MSHARPLLRLEELPSSCIATCSRRIVLGAAGSRWGWRCSARWLLAAAPRRAARPRGLFLQGTSLSSLSARCMSSRTWWSLETPTASMRCPPSARTLAASLATRPARSPQVSTVLATGRSIRRRGCRDQRTSSHGPRTLHGDDSGRWQHHRRRQPTGRGEYAHAGNVNRQDTAPTTWETPGVTTTEASLPARAPLGVPRGVIMLGLVSFLPDVSRRRSSPSCRCF